MKVLKNRKGQSLIEYLLLVAIMGVASIGAVKILSHTMQAKFVQATKALNGDSSAVPMDDVTKEHYKQRNMGDFFETSGK